MDRIIISISDLSRDNWVIIYKFIKSIVTVANIETKKNALASLQGISYGIRLNSNENPATAKDVYSLYGLEISDNSLKSFDKNTCFSILYQKENDSEDFTELVPFILIQQEFGNNVTLGIDICELNESQRSSYKFKCSDFLILHDEQKPILGKRSIYFIEQIVNEETGELFRPFASSLAGKGKDGQSEFKGNISRRFLPLIHITGDNYVSLFSAHRGKETIESRLLSNGIEKIKTELNKFESHELDIIFESGNLFGQWFEAGYFYSYDKDELKDINYQIAGMRSTLQIFKESVQELVQNIIFHGGKKGLLYCVFDKKDNISNSYGGLIPNFEKYDDKTRFVRIGVYDFSENGIVDTFDTNENVVLKDFFDINNIVTTELTRLDMRYAARLGIKTFVKTIEDHKGYFSVESCEHHDGVKTKKYIKTTLSEAGYCLEEENVVFVDGTHYEIILPVIARKVKNSFSVQTTLISKDFSQLIKSGYVLRAVKISEVNFEDICISKDKQEQLARIKRVCNEITNKIVQDRREIAIDLESRDISSNTIFKIAAYLQLSLENPLVRLIFVNVTRELNADFCSLIDKTLIKQGIDDIPLWSRDNAIILISKDLHVSVVWGKTKDELYFINRKYKELYYYRNLFDNEFNNIDDECQEAAKRFVFQYDMLISTDKKEDGNSSISLFEEYLKLLLKREIVSKEPGMLVNHKYTYIGKKIIVKNFYEADTLFQNNFYVDRFAHFIALDIEKYLPKGDYPSKKKRLVLIGYKYYSEFLLKSIKRRLEPYPVSLVICNDEKNYSDIDGTFNFSIDDDGEKTKEELLANPDGFLYSTIVPIGATLSTNDKIISFFERWLKKGNASFSKLVFFYNHCAIVVRDIIGEIPTPLEKEQKWVEVNLTEHNIVTHYQNAKTVHYVIQIANKDNPAENNWIKRLNESISFPKEWKNEKYVNHTENSSINSQNFMDFPEIYTSNEDEDEGEQLECIYKLKDFIYKGHIEILNCHHKFYVSTEEFVRQKNGLVEKWLKRLKSKILTNTGTLNVLVTPNIERESDFVRMVNDKVFDGNALIIYLDLSNWRSNIVKKLSFLENIGSAQYHYVDQAFLTGGTYFKSRNILYSIVKKESFRFNSAFTIVNRLPDPKEKDIRKELGKNLFAYAKLYYPTSKADGQECELCQLKEYYKDLEKKTVLDSCAEIINKNKKKLIITGLEETRKKLKDNKRDPDWQRRVFLRLVITHWLYYKISITASSIENFERKKKNVEEELDIIYSSLCGEPQYDNDLINLKIGQWFVGKDLFDNEDKKLALDKKMSFLKAIASPPLSQYIAIREYAHNKLLNELYKTINKDEPFSEDDLKIVKSILKSLSFLKSNALVRKDVIVGVWNVLLNVISHHDANIEKSTIQDFSKDVQFYIKSAIVEDEAKATFLGELLRQGEEIPFFDELRIHRTNLSLANCESNSPAATINNLFNVFNDCNAIFRREYISFLVWLFYDNTTIIRNTLTNFYNEIEKDLKTQELFYEKHNDEYILKSIANFRSNIDEIKDLFKNKVKEEYYYYSFKPYLGNGDGIDFVEKLIYVTYAKLKLEDLITKKHKKNIENDTRDLMEIFSAIMGADAAFWTMKRIDNNEVKSGKSNQQAKSRQIYPISLYSNNKNDKWEDVMYNMASFYTIRLYNKKKLYFPLIPTYSLKPIHGERMYFGKNSLGVYAITENQGEKESNDNKKTIVSCITFLYEDGNPIVNNEREFRIQFQEFGRLLLLLKKDMSEYVINYLLYEKVFDLWVEKLRNRITNLQLVELNRATNHIVTLGGWDFDNLSDNEYLKIYNGFIILSNVTIRHLYTYLIEHKEIKLYEGKAAELKMSEVFSDKFISLLQKISVNKLHDMTIEIESPPANKRVNGLKTVLQSYVIKLLIYFDQHFDSKKTVINFCSTYFEIKCDYRKKIVAKGMLKSDFDRKYSRKAIYKFLSKPNPGNIYNLTLLTFPFYLEPLGMICKMGFDEQETSFSVRVYYPIN